MSAGHVGRHLGATEPRPGLLTDGGRAVRVGTVDADGTPWSPGAVPVGGDRVQASTVEGGLPLSSGQLALFPSPGWRPPGDGDGGRFADRSGADLDGLRATTVPSRRSARIEAAMTIGADLTALVGSMVIGLLVLATVTGTQANSVSNLSRNLRMDAPLPIATLVLFAVYGLYRQRRRRFRPRGFHDAGLFFHALAAGSLAALGAGVLIHRVTGRPQITPGQLLALALSALVLVPLSRGACHLVLRKYWTLRTRVLIVGTGTVADQVRQHCLDDRGVEVVGMVDDDPAPGSQVLGSIAEIRQICDELAVDRVIVTFSRSHPSDTVQRLRELHGSVPISLVPRYFELMTFRSQMDDIDGLPMVDVAPSFLGPAARLLKRTLDIVGSLIGLIVTAPVLAGACVAIAVSSRGPLFFGQTRTGRDGRQFTMWKLRTMHIDAETQRQALMAQQAPAQGLFKLKRDPRVFPVGRILRQLSIDEVPQLWNVLRGEMSLVGPRPFIPEESEAFDDWACQRYRMRPGITGLWQVSGRSDLSHDQLQRLDYLYVASWSILWDLRILWKTPAVVLRARGAY